MTAEDFPELEKYRITSLPYGLYYISHFLSFEEGQSLLDKVLSLRSVALFTGDSRQAMD